MLTNNNLVYNVQILDKKKGDLVIVSNVYSIRTILC